MEKFDPKNYKSFRDLPEDKKAGFKRTSQGGDGFVHKDAIENKDVAEIFAREGEGDPARVKESLLELIHKFGQHSKNDILRGIPEPFKSDKDIVLSAVRTQGWNLSYASKEMQDDKDVVLEAVKEYPEAYQWASQRMREDAEITAFALANHEPHLLGRFIPQKFRVSDASPGGHRWEDIDKFSL